MDLPLIPADLALLDVLDGAIDVEGKIGGAVASLQPLEGRDVLLLGADRGVRRAQLEALGARVKAIGDEAPSGLEAVPAASADALVAFWTGLGLGPAAEPATLAALSRVARPGGRILLIETYGRDDTSQLFDDPARERRLTSANDRRGTMLGADFRVRVVHCWWTFADAEALTDTLERLFPATGAAVAATLRRPRVSFKVAVYHRLVEES
ncbi:MAG: hypothetical protein ACRDQC_13460 [Gaiellales bacterium]